MATPHFDPQPGALVQRFSWEMEARQRTEGETDEFSQLRSDLGAESRRRAEAKDARRREMKHIMGAYGQSRTDDHVIFEKAKLQLLCSMQKFQDLVPSDAKMDAGPMNWSTVFSAATQVQAKWEQNVKDSRSGKAKEWLRKMCNGMNNHATALKMLPSESEYVSIIGGSVAMILKASANHINISEAFAKGLVYINDAVNLEHLAHVYDSPVLQQLVMRLYAHIFAYLVKFMTWFTDRSRSRFLKSFNETALSLFQDDLDQIKQVSQLLSQQIQAHMAGDVKVSRIMLDDLSEDMQYLLKFSEAGERETRIREAANARLLQDVLLGQFNKTRDDMKELMAGFMQNYHEMLRESISGSGITSILEQQALRQLEAASISSQRQEEHLTRSGRTTPEVQTEALKTTDLRFSSRHLEDYFTWDKVRPEPTTSTPMLGDATFVSRLNHFTLTMESQTLYVYEQHTASEMNAIRVSASGYASLARSAGVPVVSYFCQLDNEQPPGNRTRETVELSALICALIRQVIDLLPVDTANEMASFANSQLSALDGTLRTWDEALALFKKLLSGVKLPLLLFVIYGNNVLEDDNTKDELQALISYLYSLQGGDQVIKLLFATSGISETLYQELREQDMVMSHTSSHGFGKRRKARQNIML